MKKIEAIIRKTKFEDVKEALLAADIEWFSYYDVLTSESRRKVSISTSMVRVLIATNCEIRLSDMIRLMVFHFEEWNTIFL